MSVDVVFPVCTVDFDKSILPKSFHLYPCICTYISIILIILKYCQSHCFPSFSSPSHLVDIDVSPIVVDGHAIHVPNDLVGYSSTSIKQSCAADGTTPPTSDPPKPHLLAIRAHLH